MLRGDVYGLRHPTEAMGREQRHDRYAVVLHSDDFMALSTVIVVPTSTAVAPARHRPEVTVLGQRTRVVPEQLAGVDPQRRLGGHVGFLPADELDQVDDAVLALLGF